MLDVPMTEEARDEWGAHVLEHGIPPAPERLEIGMSVPLARWVADDVGAVMFVEYFADPEDPDDEPWVGCDMQPYRRTPTAWDVTDSSGGGGWFDPPFVRPDMGSHEVAICSFFGSGDDGGKIEATCGVVGSGVVIHELHTQGRVIAVPIESPIGAFVVVTAAAPSELVFRLADGSEARRVTLA